MLPPRLFIRGSTSSGVKHVVFGADPRGGKLAAATLKYPSVAQVFTSFLRKACPQHLFTTRGCFGKPHRDRRNNEDHTLIVLLSEQVSGSGLWIESFGGTVPLDNNGELAFGKVVDISKPFRFDAKNILHAGFVEPGVGSSKRVILVAFCTNLLSKDLNPQLLNLGFDLPNVRKAHTLHSAPTVLQLVQSSAMQSSSVGTDDDIIEVWDPTPPNSLSPVHQLNIPKASSDPNVQDLDTQDTVLDTQDQEDLCAQKEETERVAS